MICENKNCKYYNICSRYLRKSVKDNEIIYVVPILPIHELPENCKVREYLSGG